MPSVAHSSTEERHAGSGWEASDRPQLGRPHYEDGGCAQLQARAGMSRFGMWLLAVCVLQTRLVHCIMAPADARGTLRRDIPTVGSIMAFFNKELLYSCKDDYVAAMEKLSLPVDVQKLEQWHRTAASAACAHFDKQKFGNEMLSMSGTLRDALREAIDKEYMCDQK